MKYLTLEGLTHLKQVIDNFFLHKESNESVTGVKTFETDPLFDDDKRLIDRLFEGNLIFLNVNDGEHIGSTRVEDTSNLYYDLETAPAVDGYDFVTMEYDAQNDRYNLWYIPLTNPVVSTSDEMISYINQGIVPNTKNLTAISFEPRSGNAGGLSQNITEIPPFYSKNATSISFMNSYSPHYKVTTIHHFDSSGCVDLVNSSYSCSVNFGFLTEIENLPMVDLSTVTNFSYIFQYCESLKTIPPYDFSGAVNMFGSFGWCSSIEIIPPLNTVNCTTFTITFRECSKLEVIQGLNLTSCANTTNMFEGCTSLREVHIDFGNNSNSALNTLFNGLTFGDNQMINLYVKNIPQSVRTAIESNYGSHVTIIDEV